MSSHVLFTGAQQLVLLSLSRSSREILSSPINESGSPWDVPWCTWPDINNNNPSQLSCQMSTFVPSYTVQQENGNNRPGDGEHC